MKNILFLHISILVMITLISVKSAFSCSMYKVTAFGKTMVGNNEDSWGHDAKIWFEPGSNGKYSVVCVGYERKQPHPDGAMNEFGLVFDAFTMPHKGNIPEKDSNKKDFAYSHIKTIMQQCKTVDEVYAFLEKLNLHVLDGSPIFNGGMLFFVDKTGKYLAVEANKMTLGNDSTFALANFSIADTKDLSTIKTKRYCRGIAYLQNKPPDTSLSFCKALSDTMSENRPKVGDGTLYTSIYDIKEGLVHIYFFHDFSQHITFNITDEFAKGEHSYKLAELFPWNKNYQKFLHYKTPQNNLAIKCFMIACSLLFLFSFVFFMRSFFKNSITNFKHLKLGIAVLSLAFGVYAFVLLGNEGIFYFPSPYKHVHSLLLSITSYLPFVLLLVILPLLIMMVKILQQKMWSRLAKYLFVLNNIAYMLLICLFVYWKLFDISL